jgi:hypothetical protein
MKTKHKVTGHVTLKAYTIVEADSVAEAVAIARKRPVAVEESVEANPEDGWILTDDYEEPEVTQQ